MNKIALYNDGFRSNYMILSIISSCPTVVPHKTIHNVKSFVCSPDGVTVVRKVSHFGSLCSDFFKFGKIFVGCSWEESNDT